MDLIGFSVWEVLSFAAQIWFCWEVGKFIGTRIAIAYSRKELSIAREIAANYVFVKIEPITRDGEITTLLVFNSTTNEFVGQAETPEGVIEMIFNKFTNKELFLQHGDTLVPLVRPITK